MSTWLFDLGNTRLKFAPLRDDGTPGEIIGAAHDGGRFDPAWLAGLPQRFDTALVASVASPALRVALLELLAARCRRITLATTCRVLAGVTIAYPEPSRLGVDRFLALLAAHARLPGRPVLLGGVGTALTIDLLDATGLHRGGRIAPSPALMREALHRRASHLPGHGGDYAEFAVDTADALVSGCDGAALGLIERSLAAATGLLGTPPSLLLHGGGAAALQPHLPAATLCTDLVLAGLARWHCAIVRTPLDGR
ncbi:type III pantothenate kinase [Luteimonas sp. BDR2-5]|uniref:type III pantothenate kinase n=1 Tax=Proluteimonas luteida TaxID=2878685 RepID=UPI001E2AEFD9|nr:type III pantothenate kinase [Luteimonas sp. BDR2-5]MCD9029331.1 type III pantothenate kinase [Luteimonas sp. BDR2-5]